MTSKVVPINQTKKYKELLEWLQKEAVDLRSFAIVVVDGSGKIMLDSGFIEEDEGSVILNLELLKQDLVRDLLNREEDEEE